MATAAVSTNAGNNAFKVCSGNPWWGNLAHIASRVKRSRPQSEMRILWQLEVKAFSVTFKLVLMLEIAVADAIRTSLGPRGMDKMIQNGKGQTIIVCARVAFINSTLTMVDKRWKYHAQGYERCASFGQNARGSERSAGR